MSGLALCASAEEQCEVGLPWEWGQDPDLWLYRDRTVAILLRFFRLSMEVGRLPSVLGREFFRTHVTSHHFTSFEDVVIFVHDVERCLGRLDPLSRKMIARVVFQGYTQEEAARVEGFSRKHVGRRYREAIDQFSEILLRAGVLKKIENPPDMEEEKSCQEAESDEKLVTM